MLDERLTMQECITSIGGLDIYEKVMDVLERKARFGDAASLKWVRSHNNRVRRGYLPVQGPDFVDPWSWCSCVGMHRQCNVCSPSRFDDNK